MMKNTTEFADTPSRNVSQAGKSPFLLTGLAVTGGALLSATPNTEAAIVYSGVLDITLSAGNTATTFATLGGLKPSWFSHTVFGRFGRIDRTGGGDASWYNHAGGEPRNFLANATISTLIEGRWASAQNVLFYYNAGSFKGGGV